MADEVMRRRLVKMGEQNRQNDREFKKKSSKEKLRVAAQKKIDTTMIGAINKMEIFMGKQWGHGLEEDECTDAQLDWYEVWQQCRQEILDLGNKQKRSLISELDLYDVEFKGYQYNFVAVDNKGARND